MEKKIYIYNTLDKQKEELKLINSNECRMYSCGPTVYDYAHIGNFRYFLFVDLLRRTLKYNNIKMLHVMNITDVGHLVSDADEGEDKMIKASKREQKSPFEIAKYYESVFLNDMQKLNMDIPEKIVRVTDHIKEMEEYVKEIIKNGYTYQTEDTIYFDTSKLPKYGVLSNINVDMQKAGARVEFDSKKRNATDFALWIKAPKEHIMRWDSFFGESYPGWHLECSALSKKYLGEKFDIHTGGEDHIHIHHENEIAQSMGHSNINPANYWIHSAFLQVNNGKMSKSLGNTYTITQLEQMGYHPLDFRYFTYTAHYRTKLNFTIEALNASKESLKNLRKLYFEHKNSNNLISEKNRAFLEEKKSEFEENIFNDLNIPKALATVWEIAKIEEKSKEVSDLLNKLDEVLALKLSDENLNSSKNSNIQFEDLANEIQEIVEKRKKAREDKDYALSDILRDKLKEAGILVKDTKDGMEFTKI